MLTAIQAIAITVAVLPIGAIGESADIPVLTVCELMQSLPAHKGTTIVVVGRLGSTSEGSWLDQKCTEKLVTDGYEWGSNISLSYLVSETVPSPILPRNFHWDKKILARKLAEVEKTTTLRVYPQYHYTDRWIAVFGRLETHFPLDPGVYPSASYSTGYHPAGYGHLNGSPAQLVWPQRGFYEFSRHKEKR